MNNRRTARAALVAGIVIVVTGCYDGREGTFTIGPGSAERAGVIADNHGHVATLTGAQLDAGDPVSLDIRGSADHSHTITLSGAEVVQIRNRERVTVASTTDTSPTVGTHSHTVTFN